MEEAGLNILKYRFRQTCPSTKKYFMEENKKKRKISKSTFLKDVRYEVEMLRQHATDDEKENLVFRFFDPDNFQQCIYGLMTGDCRSHRAQELMDKSCIRVMDIPKQTFTSNSLNNSSFNDPRFVINGKYSGQTWKDDESYKNRRDMRFLSALEGYIYLKDAKNRNVLDYIKGKIDVLEL